MKTLNNVTDALEAFTSGHTMLNGFGLGHTSNIGTDKNGAQLEYPYLHVDYSSADYAVGSNNRGIYQKLYVMSITVMDKYAPNVQNSAEVMSDTEAILSDVLQWFMNSPIMKEFRLDLTNVEARPVRDADKDGVEGWTTNIAFKVPYKYCSSNLPVNVTLTEPSTDCSAINIVNGSTLINIVGGTTKNFTIQDTDANPITITQLSDSSTEFVGEINTGVAPLNTANVYKTGADTVYQAKDDASQQFGRGSDFLTLDYDNGFGNTSRFTDSLGTQVYASGIAFDWAHWDQVSNTVPGIHITPESNNTLTNHLNAQPYTRDGYDDWYVVNIKQLFSLANYSLFRSYLNYPPFNLDTSLSTNRVWSSTRESASVGTFLSNVGISVTNHSASYKTFLTRNYTLTSLSL